MRRYFPDKRQFLRLASRKAAVIPVYREVLADLETPVSAFLKIGDVPHAYLLESVEGGEKVGRFSFIGGDPHLVFSSHGRDVTLAYRGKPARTFKTDRDPLHELQKVLGRYRQAPVKGLPPFSGGAVGYMGYDMVRFFERVPDKNPDAQGIPDSLFIFADTLCAFDHLNKKMKVICNAVPSEFTDPAAAYDAALEKIENLIAKLRATSAPAATAETDGVPPPPRVRSNMTRGAFVRAVRKAKAYIKKGDIFQVVLSQAFQSPVRSQAFDIYRALRSVNPSPYMFYIHAGNFRLVGSSPEVHVRCEGDRAALRPIAGTRPRGRTDLEDAALEKELLADPKERAEHVMLVDLGRNDLGRVCAYKSVRVRDFMTIERYSHVMHIVSHVEGRLGRGRTAFDLLRATFPAGTISGAPKVRAMEIIDELENRRRGFYAGIVGYFGYNGNLDSCITIRTLLVKDGLATVQAGAGIVADSDPGREYQETVNKAKGLIQAVAIAESGVSA